jgi:hypothetical protein
LVIAEMEGDHKLYYDMLVIKVYFINNKKANTRVKRLIVYVGVIYAKK